MIDGRHPRFLIVDDDVAVQRSLARIVRRHGEFVGAGTVQEAGALLRDGSEWAAILLDIGLPDGSGLDLLVELRTAHPITPVMILTGHNRDAAANAAHDLRAHYVVKPVSTQRVERFLNDAVSLDSRIESALREWAGRYGLSQAEADLLGRTALGESRFAICAARRTSRETLKTQVASLLAKTGDDTLQVAAARLLHNLARV